MRKFIVSLALVAVGVIAFSATPALANHKAHAATKLVHKHHHKHKHHKAA